MQSEPPRIPWFYNYIISRHYIVQLLRLRSGHYPCKKFAFLMRKVTSADCDVCNTTDDIQHILLECAKNRTRREAMMAKFNINKYDLGVFLSILAEPTTELAKCLVDIVCNC